MKQPKPTIHPDACPKLVRFFRQVKREAGTWNIRETARRLGVNQKYVHDNLIHGTEPTDATESGRETRTKIFLKATKPKPREKKEAKPIKLPPWLEEAAREWFTDQRQKVKDMSRKTKTEALNAKADQYPDYCTCLYPGQLIDGNCPKCGLPFFPPKRGKR